MFVLNFQVFHCTAFNGNGMSGQKAMRQTMSVLLQILLAEQETR
jgi:hypothetical protein